MPQEKAVAPAAESVTRLLLDRVREEPTRCLSSVRMPFSGRSETSVSIYVEPINRTNAYLL